MQGKKIVLTGFGMAGTLIIGGLLTGLKSTGQVLGTLNPLPTPTVIPTATPTITPTPTASPSATPTPTKIPSPTTTPTPIPDPGATDIFGLTERFAVQYGVDANKLRAIAQCESGFNSQAAHLAYAGLYQFTPGSWTRYRARMSEDTHPDLRYDPEAAIKTAAFVMSQNESYIWPACISKL